VLDILQFRTGRTAFLVEQRILRTYKGVKYGQRPTTPFLHRGVGDTELLDGPIEGSLQEWREKIIDEEKE